MKSIKYIGVLHSSFLSVNQVLEIEHPFDEKSKKKWQKNANVAPVVVFGQKGHWHQHKKRQKCAGS